MNIQKTQGPSFKGPVYLTRQADAKNPILRPLINYFKHHNGGSHKIHFDDNLNTIIVTALPGPDGKIYAGKGAAMDLYVTSPKKIEAEEIKKIIKLAEESKNFFQASKAMAEEIKAASIKEFYYLHRN